MESRQKAGDKYKIRTICPLCPNHGGIVATVQDGKITKFTGDREHPISRGYICDKGSHAWEAIYQPNRFKHPLLRIGPDWKEIAWEEALDIAADRLAELKSRFGPLSFCSAQCYPFQRE